MSVHASCGGLMSDIAALVLIVVFFLVSLGLIRLCDRLK
jgi:hypothetical protein